MSGKIFLRGLFVTVFLLWACVGSSQAVEDSVVKVLTVSNEPDYAQPWQMVGSQSASGSGCIVSGQRILTAAHVVSDRTFVQVQRVGDPTKYEARVEFIGHDCDLALLRVKEKAFFRETTPLQIGELPGLRDTVAVYGFPIGGDKLSITEGVVSRIEMTEYAHSQRNLLSVQIDAPINPGNSGGPVVQEGRVVGIAHQGLEKAENVGYMIPPLIINHFLEDVKDGRYDGFPYDDIYVQRLENRAHRAFLGMNEDQTGVLVTRVAYGSSSWGIIMSGDVILEVDGVTIANDGTIPFGPRDRIDMTYLLIKRHLGDTMRLKILRAGQVQEASLVLKGGEDIVPGLRYDVKPDYYIFGGLVFVRLTLNYLATWEEWAEAPSNLVNHYLSDIATPERQEIVVLRGVLADSVNVGYHDYANRVVERVNGRGVCGMGDLVDKIENAEGPYVEVGLEGGEKIVLDIGRCKGANSDILERYGIPSDRSESLRMPRS
jgi:S1-C subfamily serine protease